MLPAELCGRLDAAFEGALLVGEEETRTAMVEIGPKALLDFVLEGSDGSPEDEAARLLLLANRREAEQYIAVRLGLH